MRVHFALPRQKDLLANVFRNAGARVTDLDLHL